MNIDFENALQQEPVQAVMMVIMKYLTDDQRKIVWEKLGERVDQNLPDEAALKAEAEKYYPYSKSGSAEIMKEFSLNDVREWQRVSHIDCARKYISRIKELEERSQKLVDALNQINRCRDEPFRVANIIQNTLAEHNDPSITNKE